jgi:hypothetical protein
MADVDMDNVLPPGAGMLSHKTKYSLSASITCDATDVGARLNVYQVANKDFLLPPESAFTAPQGNIVEVANAGPNIVNVYTSDYGRLLARIPAQGQARFHCFSESAGGDVWGCTDKSGTLSSTAYWRENGASVLNNSLFGASGNNSNTTNISVIKMDTDKLVAFGLRSGNTLYVSQLTHSAGVLTPGGTVGSVNLSSRGDPIATGYCRLSTTGFVVLTSGGYASAGTISGSGSGASVTIGSERHLGTDATTALGGGTPYAYHGMYRSGANQFSVIHENNQGAYYTGLWTWTVSGTSISYSTGNFSNITGGSGWASPLRAAILAQRSDLTNAVSIIKKPAVSTEDNVYARALNGTTVRSEVSLVSHADNGVPLAAWMYDATTLLMIYTKGGSSSNPLYIRAWTVNFTTGAFTAGTEQLLSDLALPSDVEIAPGTTLSALIQGAGYFSIQNYEVDTAMLLSQNVSSSIVRVRGTGNGGAIIVTFSVSGTTVSISDVFCPGPSALQGRYSLAFLDGAGSPQTLVGGAPITNLPSQSTGPAAFMMRRSGGALRCASSSSDVGAFIHTPTFTG